MKTTCYSIAVLFAVLCCAEQSATTAAAPNAALEKKLDAYFQQYCDQTAGMGPDFVARDCYEIAFRQRLKQTQDAELKLYFVLKNLFPEIEFEDLQYFEKGTKYVSKGETLKLTTAEIAAERVRIERKIRDLEEFVNLDDPDDNDEDGHFHHGERHNKHFIDVLKRRFKQAVETHATR
jgi:hypothetical protein